MNPGEVDIVVYPPLSIADWTLDDLPERIDEVRQLYLDTLKDWPEDKVPVHPIYKKAPAKKAVKKVAAKKAAKKAPAKKAPAAKSPNAKGRK
jgi:putative phosphoserine phosphatase/1-acylglycerol-3-phosphate O-acyltransferase